MDHLVLLRITRVKQDDIELKSLCGSRFMPPSLAWRFSPTVHPDRDGARDALLRLATNHVASLNALLTDLQQIENCDLDEAAERT